MDISRVLLLAVLVASLCGCGRKVEEVSAGADKASEVVCAYAPSQKASVLAISATAGGVGAGAAAVASAAGLTAVVHSSGAYIFTGVGGYIAGTLGVAALVPVAVTVGAVAGGAAATVELLCAPKNHPELVSKVMALSEELVGKVK